MQRTGKKVFFFLLALLVLAIPLLAGGKQEAAKPEPRKSEASAGGPEPFDLQALIQAAQKEGEVVAYFTSSRIKDVGTAFEKKYGIKVKGTKMGDPEQAERVIREVDSKNVLVDVIGFEDGALLEGKLIPEGYVVNWVPPDIAPLLSPEDRNPLVFLWQPRIFGYNFESYKEPPIKNIWQLTEPAWKGKIMIRDPAQTPANLAFFANITANPKLLEEAYQSYYGKPSGISEKDLGWEFLKRLFQNELIVMRSDEDVGDAVGAAGQKEAPIGFYTLTKQRDNKAKNLKLATMKGMVPFMGYALPTYALMVKNCPHPNAAKLLIHFILSEGHTPWTARDMGAFSPNQKAPPHPDNEGTWSDWQKRLLRIDNKVALKLRQDILDLWLEYGHKK